MHVPLATNATDATVQGGLIDVAGWVFLLGGIALTALWVRSLAR